MPITGVRKTQRSHAEPSKWSQRHGSGFSAQRPAAIDAGQHPVEMIAPREEVNGTVAGREAGHRHITVGYRRGEAGFAHSMVNDSGWVQTLS